MFFCVLKKGRNYLLVLCWRCAVPCAWRWRGAGAALVLLDCITTVLLIKYFLLLLYHVRKFFEKSYVFYELRVHVFVNELAPNLRFNYHKSLKGSPKHHELAGHGKSSYYQLLCNHKMKILTKSFL